MILSTLFSEINRNRPSSRFRIKILLTQVALMLWYEYVIGFGLVDFKCRKAWINLFCYVNISLFKIKLNIDVIMIITECYVKVFGGALLYTLLIFKITVLFCNMGHAVELIRSSITFLFLTLNDFFWWTFVAFTIYLVINFLDNFALTFLRIVYWLLFIVQLFLNIVFNILV